MSYLACSIKLSNDKGTSEIWSGVIFSYKQHTFCLTTFSPLLGLLSCDQLENLHDVGNLSLEVSNLSADISYAGKLPPNNLTGDKKLVKLKSLNDKNCYSWKSSKLESILSKLLINDAKERDKFCCRYHSSFNFCSWFLLLVTSSTYPEPVTVHKTLKHIGGYLSESLIGKEILTCSHPFGSSHSSIFGDCLSKGIVSSFIEGSLILTDARCLPGSEGGALYSKKGLLGIIVSPIALKTGQQSGFSAGCAIDEVCQSFAVRFGLSESKADLLSMASSFSTSSSQKLVTFKTGPPTVIIKTSYNWGSGAVAGFRTKSDKFEAIVVTCKHTIVRESLDETVSCIYLDNMHSATYLQGVVKYKASSDWFDFAIITVECTEKFVLAITSYQNTLYKSCGKSSLVLSWAQSYQSGSGVCMKGYTLFDDMRQQPLLSKGIISKVCLAKLHDAISSPVLLHTTCVVLSGCSGGPLFTEDGSSIVGLVVSNVKELIEGKDMALLYSDVSFILPANLFMPSVLKFINGTSNWTEKLILADKFEAANKHWELGMVCKTPKL